MLILHSRHSYRPLGRLEHKMSSPNAERRTQTRGTPAQTSFALPSTKRTAADRVVLGEDWVEVIGTFQTFGVKLVEVLRTRWARGKPSAVRNNLQTADR